MSNGKLPFSIIAFCLIIAGATLAIFDPKLVIAEIATTTDWIGLFRSGSSGQANCGNNGATSCDKKTGTVNGNSWVYANSCTQSPGPVPMFDRSGIPPNPSPCTFTVSPPPVPGNYEYRMYANDQETTDALIDTSIIVTVQSAAAGAPCPVQSPNPRAEGLISAPTISNNFGNPAGQCVISSQAAFAPYKIPNYATLKSLYYTQSKLTKTTITSLPASFSGNGIYNAPAAVTIPSPSYTPTGTGTEVIFMDADLNINGDIIYHTNDGNGGLVFVVSGNVYIDKSVTQIDAVIISSGTIYTAYNPTVDSPSTCITPNLVNVGASANALTINGSLISLNPGSIMFCRRLTDNSNPAEIINQQAKYLVLLRDLYSDTSEKWSEIQ